MSTLSGLSVVGYLRVSTDKQDASLKEQRQWFEGLCQREHHDPVAVFEDENISGHVKDRPQFQRLLSLCEQRHREGKPIQAVAIYVLSRFSRSDVIATATSWERLRQAGVRYLITSKKTYDLDSNADQVLLAVEQTGESTFSPTLAQNVTRSLIARARDGKPVSGCPYGYRVVYRQPDGPGRMVPVEYVLEPTEAATVARIFRLYASGAHSLRSICEALNREGVPPPSQSKGRSLRGNHWANATIRQILRRDSYTGTRVWNRRAVGRFVAVIDGRVEERTREDRGKEKTTNPVHHITTENVFPPIVSVEVFQSVADMLDRARRKPSPCRGKNIYLLSGLVRCMTCGKVMVGKTVTAPGYYCTTQTAGGRSACDPNRILEAPLIKALAGKLQSRFNPETIAELRAAIERQLTAPDPVAEEIKAIEARLEVATRETRKLSERLLRCDESLIPELEKVLLAAVKERDRLAGEVNTRRADLKHKPPAELSALVESAIAAVDHLDEVFERSDRREVRAFLQTHIDRIDCYFLPAVRGQKSRRFQKALLYVRDDSPFALLIDPGTPVIPSEHNRSKIHAEGVMIAVISQQEIYSR